MRSIPATYSCESPARSRHSAHACVLVPIWYMCHRGELLSSVPLRYKADVRIDLRGIRQAAGLTQDQLGTRLGISRAHVSRLETGAREIDLSVADEWLSACNYTLSVVPAGDELVTQLGKLEPEDRELIRRLTAVLPLPAPHRATLAALIDVWAAVRPVKKL